MFRQNGAVAGVHALLILLLDFEVIFRFFVFYCLSDPLSGEKGTVK